MIIPKKVWVGGTKYTVNQPDTLQGYKRGYVSYSRQTISIARATMFFGPLSPTDRAETFWHELTHAILHDMDNPLAHNEMFVTEFSSRLADAIQTAEL